MQDFHYNYIKDKNGDKAEMLITDSDGLMYKTEAENLYEGFYNDKKLFEFSKYTKYSKHYNNANNLVVGKMKDEAFAMPIEGFVGLNLKFLSS